MYVDCCYCLLFDLVLSMVASEVWDCNKNQASALEVIILNGAKKILKPVTMQLEGVWVWIH